MLQFDIFVGDVNSPNDNKTFVVGINYPSHGCGRVSNHISFSDKLNLNAVGQIKEYAVKAVQGKDSSAQVYTSASVFAYRIPFLAEIGGFVKTNSQGGVMCL